MRCAVSVQGRLERRLLGLGLTDSQFGVLEALLHLGPSPQHELGRALFTSRANVTTVVDNLERRGLVRRQRDAVDRRLVIVHLTADGRALIEQVFPGQVQAIVEEFAALSADEQEMLGQLCKQLGTHGVTAPARGATGRSASSPGRLSDRPAPGRLTGIICRAPRERQGGLGERLTDNDAPVRERKSAAWWDEFWHRPLQATGRALTCRRTAEEALRLLAPDLDRLAPGQRLRVLDLGCGHGDLTPLLLDDRRLEIVALDLSAAALGQFRARLGASAPGPARAHPGQRLRASVPRWRVRRRRQLRLRQRRLVRGRRARGRPRAQARAASPSSTSPARASTTGWRRPARPGAGSSGTATRAKTSTTSVGGG